MKISILGSGLSGLLSAYYLLKIQRITKIEIFSKEEQTKSSSYLPYAMVQPFAGRSFKVNESTLEAFDYAKDFYKSFKSEEEKFISEVNLLRPISKEHLSSNRLLESFKKLDKEVINKYKLAYLTRKELDRLRPVLPKYFSEAIEVGCFFSLNSSSFLKKLKAELKKNDKIHWIEDEIKSIKPLENQILLLGKSNYKRDKVMLCGGEESSNLYKNCPLKSYFGEVKVLDQQDPLIDHGLSFRSHIIPFNDLIFTGGNFREKQKASKEEMAKALDQISYIMPDYLEENIKEVWSGARMTYQTDKLPLAGIIDNNKNIAAVTALGSRGFLWAPLLAKKTTDLLLTGKDEIPAELNTKRSKISLA